MCQWRDVIADSSAPILFSQNQHETARTVNQIVMVGRPEVLSFSAKFQVQILYCLPEISR